MLLLGINLITRGEYLSGRVREAIVEAARGRLGYEVGMERLVFNFFPTYIDLYGPYITGWDPEDPAGKASAESARVYFSLPALLNRQVVISRIQVNGARLRLVRNRDGGFNTDGILAKLTEKGEEGNGAGRKQGFGVSVREVVVLGSSIRYADRANDLIISTDDAGMDIRILDDGLGLSANVTDIIAMHGKTPPMRMDVAGDMVYRKGAVEVGSLKVLSKGSRLTGSGRIVLSDRPELDLKLDARIELKLLGSLALLEGPVSGSVRLGGVVKGVYPDLVGEGSLHLDKTSYAGIEIERLYSGLRFEAGSISLDGITGSAYGGTVDGYASADFKAGGPVYTSSLRFKGVNTGRFTSKRRELEFIPWYTASGVVNIGGSGMELPGLRASGSVVLETAGNAREAAAANPELSVIKKVVVDFRFADSLFDIKSARVDTEYVSVNLKGTVGLNGKTSMSLSGSSSDIGEISTMIGYSDMDGQLDVTATVTGDILSPDIRGKARISNATAGGVAFTSAFGGVELSNWRLTFTDFLIQPEKGSMRLNGSIYFQGDGARFNEPYFDAALELKDVDARRITSIFYEDIPVNVSASGEMAFKGNTKDFAGKAHLVTGTGDVYGQKVDKGEVWAELTSEDISFPKVIAVLDRDIVTASGKIGFDGTFDAKASSARVDLENFNLLMETGAPVKGSVSVSMRGVGSFDEPVVSAKISAYSLFLKDVDLGEATLDAQIKDARLSGKGSLLDDRVTLDGFLELDAPYRWSGRLAFEQGRFEPFVRMVYDRLPDDVSFVSTGVLTAQGAVDEPENDTASISFSQVKAVVMGRELGNRGDIKMSYTSRGIEVSSLNLKGEGLDVSVRGRADFEEGFKLDVSLDMDLDALRGVLGDSVDYIDGRCEARLKVGGPIDDPVYAGTVGIKDAGVKFRDFPQRLDELSAKLVLDGKVFELISLDAKLGGGTVKASGRGGLKGFSFDNFSFAVEASDVKVKYPENLTSTINAKLFAEGAEDKRSVSGEIFMVKASYTERIEWKSWLLQFEKKRKEVEEPGRGPFDDVALNVHVTGPRNIRIDNNVAKIPVTPDLYVRGTIGRPVLLGRMEATEGQVYFRNNSFRLLSAVVEFADPTRLNPIIDLQAETHVREYTIQMTVSGTLDRLSVSLLSDPPLEEADIITLLTLGRTSEGLTGHEAAITTGEAASFVTGQIQDAVEERVRRLTGFDRFQIDPYLTSTGASSGPRLTVGKSLFSDKLYITYSSNLGTSEDQFIRLEYIINRNLSLVGERDELGRFGGDIKLRFNFR